MSLSLSLFSSYFNLCPMRCSASEEASLSITASWNWLKGILQRDKHQQDAEVDVVRLLQRSYKAFECDTGPTFRKLGLKRYCEMTLGLWGIKPSLIFGYFLWLRSILSSLGWNFIVPVYFRVLIIHITYIVVNSRAFTWSKLTFPIWDKACA